MTLETRGLFLATKLSPRQASRLAGKAAVRLRPFTLSPACGDCPERARNLHSPFPAPWWRHTFRRKTFSIDWAFLRNPQSGILSQSISFFCSSQLTRSALLKTPGYETGGKLGEDLVHIGSESIFQVRSLAKGPGANGIMGTGAQRSVLTCSISTKVPFPVISR